jgi:hypothetical protein
VLAAPGGDDRWYVVSIRPGSTQIRRRAQAGSWWRLLPDFSDAVCVDSCHQQAARDRDPAGRVRNATRRRGQWAVARPSHSIAAWCGAHPALRYPALRTTVGRGWLIACVLRRGGGRNDPRPRRQSGGATRRIDPAYRQPRIPLLLAVHPLPRIRVGVCPRPLRRRRPGLCRGETRSARLLASWVRSLQSASFSSLAWIIEFTARPVEILC